MRNINKQINKTHNKVTIKAVRSNLNSLYSLTPYSHLI